MTSPPAPRSHERLIALDGLRGVAILAVLVYHCFAMLPKADGAVFLEWLGRLCSRGWVGVDLFFTLSGFLIARILLKERSSPAYFVAFYGRRVARIIPLYCVWLGLYFLLKYGTAIAATPGGNRLVGNVVPDWSHVVFLQNLFMAENQTFGNGWLGVSWSLAVEEQFYLAFPFLVRWVRPRVLVGMLALSVPVALFLRTWCMAAAQNSTAAYALLPCRMDAMACGALVAATIHFQRSWFEASRWARWAGPGLIGVGALLAAMHLNGTPANNTPIGYSIFFTWIQLVSCGLVWVAVHPAFAPFQTAISAGPLRFFGSTSYFLYLFHRPVVALTGLALTGSHPDWATPQGVLAMLTSLSLLIVLSALSYRFFELPLIRRASCRFLYDSSAQRRRTRSSGLPDPATSVAK